MISKEEIILSWREKEKFRKKRYLDNKGEKHG
jgi:hypothetical protein